MRSRLGRLALILALAIPVLTGRADAAPSDCTIWWTNAAGNGLWSTAGNWSATVDGSGAAGVPVASDVVCAATTTNGPFIQINSGSVSVRGADLPASTSLIVVGSGDSLTLSDAAAPATFGDFSLNTAGTRLTSAAPVVVLGRTTLRGTLNGDVTTKTVQAAGGTVNGDLTFADGGISVFTVDSPGGNGNLTVTGTATLAGDLSATATNGYVPTLGASYDLITAGNIQGGFNGQFAYKKFGNAFIDDEFTATTVKAVVKPLPVLTIGDAPDVSESDGTATITVNRQNPMDRDVKVSYATVDDTAVAGTDYTSRSGTLTFAPGETSKTFTVPILDDSAVNADVAFKVHLSNPVNGIIADETNDHRLQIFDDDAVDPSGCTIWWTGAAGGLWSAAGSWSATADGGGAPGVPDASDVVCAAATTSTPFIQVNGGSDVTVRGADLPASTSLVVVGGSSVTLSEATAPATFGDLTLNSVDTTLTSAGPVVALGTTVLRGTLNGDLTTKNLQGAGGTVDGNLTLADGGLSVFWIDLTDSNGNLTVTGTATLGGDLVATASNDYIAAIGTSHDLITAGDIQGTFNGQFAYKKFQNAFIDDEFTATTVKAVVKALPIFAIGDTPDVVESDGAATVTIERGKPMDRDVKVSYTTVDDTAKAGTDYTSTSGTVTFAPGETIKTFTVPILDDDEISPQVAFKVHLSDPVNGVIAEEANDHLVQIYNDDPPVIESIEGGPVRQGSANQLLTLHGLGLGSTTDIVFARPGLAVDGGTLRVIDDATVTVRVSAKAGMRTGRIATTLFADAGEATCVDCLSVVSRPVASSVAPAVLGAGASRQSVTVLGSGFVDGTAVTIAGASVQDTEFVSATELRVTLSVPATRAPGAAYLKVANPDGGSSVCRTCAIFVAGPTLDGTNALAVRRGTEQTVHLIGTGFVDGLTLTGPTGVTFTDLVVSPTEITATVTVAGTTPIASGRKITVTNPISAGWGTVVGSILTVCTKTAPSCGP